MRKKTLKLKALIVLWSVVFCFFPFKAELHARLPRLIVVGSTTMLPLSEHLATKYKKALGVDVLVQGGGSSAGPIALLNNIAQIAASSRVLTKEESINLKVFVIAHDVLAIVVHPSNPINNISLNQLKDILAGKITNWKDLGAPFSKPIQLINDSSGNGTRAAIEELVMGKSKAKKINGTPITLMSVVTNSSSEMKANIANFKYALGYLPFSYLDNTVKALSVDNIPPTYAAAYKGEYPLFRDLYYAIRKDSKGLELAYIYYVLSPEGQDIVVQEGFLPIKLITSVEELDRIKKSNFPKRS
ncbi:MAG: phosphate ABC transporter substrate-binding protein [Candidatus Melainabacteria bacterium]|nr:phosphate ABC transporter substrate-binding protein [Candidatus Melainabacteria bacterium]